MISKAMRLLLAIAASIIIAPSDAAEDTGPYGEWDPNTISTCVTWETPRFGQTCDEYLNDWRITPQQFREFNPSVGVDGSGWDNSSMTAYCIADEAREDELYATATFDMSMFPKHTRTPMSLRTPTHTIEGVAVPSPTVWNNHACYVDKDPAKPILGRQLIAADDELTWAKCKARCWEEMPRIKATVAGMKNGNECWCGTEEYWPRVRDEDLVAKLEDCDIPCTGDTSVHCGGKDLIEVAPAVVITGTGMPWGGVKATSTSAPAGSAAPTGGQSSSSGSPQSAANGRVATSGSVFAAIFTAIVLSWYI